MKLNGVRGRNLSIDGLGRVHEGLDGEGLGPAQQLLSSLKARAFWLKPAEEAVRNRE